MSITRFSISTFAAGLMALGAGLACGQNFPTQPIRFVTAEAGGAADFAARVIAQGLTAPLGQPVIVENRGAVAAPEIVAKAPPDGYTLMVGSNFWIATLARKTSYDPVRDFSPITIMAMAPLVLVVPPSLPVKSVKDLIALAKARPGELNYMAGAPGSTNHLNGEMFKNMAGINIVGVFFKASGPGTISLIGGEVQLSLSGAGGVAAHIKSGKLKALAVTSAQPSALFPGLPTVAATLPDFEFTSIYGLWAPARTPEAIIRRLNQETVRFLNQPEVKDNFLKVGNQVVGNSPEEFSGVINTSIARLSKVIKDAGLDLH